LLLWRRVSRRWRLLLRPLLLLLLLRPLLLLLLLRRLLRRLLLWSRA